MTYKIIGKTNPWIAQRDPIFNGRTVICLGEFKTLKEANRMLMNMAMNDYEVYYPNWGLMCIHLRGACGTNSNGERYYEYDSRMYHVYDNIELPF